MMTTATIYLDHNATTPLRPEAREAMSAAMLWTGNPSSVHAAGRQARRIVEDARERVAGLVGAAPAEVIFTSGGTEANALAMCGTGRRRILVSAVEHTSVLRAGAPVTIIPVDGRGVVCLDALAALLSAADEPVLISVMLANNETGVLQPVAEVAALARRHGAWLHCDAAQAAGKIGVNVRHLGVHLLSLSAHKLGGPPGVGALIVDPAVSLTPLLHGGGQERGRRAGSENVVGIAGFGAAAARAASLEEVPGLSLLRDAFERRLRRICPSVRVFGSAAARLPNTSCLTMPGVESETQVIAFDLEGIAVSAGSACSSGKVTRSHVLAAMGVGEDIARTAIRVSLGWNSRMNHVDRFVEAWTGIYARAHGPDRGRAEPAAVVALG